MTSWPQRLTGAQVRGLFARLGLEITADGPLARFVDGEVEPIDPDLAADPLVVRAVEVLASPRKLLVVGGTSQTTPPGLFLTDGDAVVRFEMGSVGCMFSPPDSPDQFARLVCALAGAEQVEDGEAALVSRFFLDVLSSVAALTEPTIEEARAAVAEVLERPELAEQVLEELIAEGPASVDGNRLALDGAWLADHPFLLAPTGLKVVAHEWADMVAGLSRPTAISVIESAPRRMVVLPPSLTDSTPETVLTFEPLGGGPLRSAVLALLSPVASPPAQPEQLYEGDPRTWLSAPGGSPGPWHTGFWERIVALEPDLPGPLLAPGATIEVSSRGGVRHVVGLTADSAVEWTTTGSTVHWRTLSGGVGDRIAELVPGQRDAPAPAVCCLVGDSSMSALMAGRRDDDVPTELHALAGDPAARWAAIRALSMTGEVLHGVELLVAESGGELWRFEPEDGGRRASRVTFESVLDEIRSSLAPIAPDV